MKKQRWDGWVGVAGYLRAGQILKGSTHSGLHYNTGSAVLIKPAQWSNSATRLYSCNQVILDVLKQDTCTLQTTNTAASECVPCINYQRDQLELNNQTIQGSQGRDTILVCGLIAGVCVCVLLPCSPASPGPMVCP